MNEDHEILRRSFEVDGADEPVVRCSDALSALAQLLAERDRLRVVVDALLGRLDRTEGAEALRDDLRQALAVLDVSGDMGGEDGT